jgi:hypothetical protein
MIGPDGKVMTMKYLLVTFPNMMKAQGSALECRKSVLHKFLYHGITMTWHNADST